jgi:hypothetical protein
MIEDVEALHLELQVRPLLRLTVPGVLRLALARAESNAVISRRGHDRMAARYRPGDRLAGDARSHGRLRPSDCIRTRPHSP